MSERSCLAIILAAGEGTRMRSRIPKVMHKVAGLPLIGHVLAAARASGASRCAVVAGPDAQAVRAFVGEHAPDAALYEQSERLGTAHAVLAARREFSAGFDDVLVLYGDTPLITSSTLVELRKALLDADVVVLGFRSAQPFGYGRLLVENGRLRAIREERDASPQERQLDFCNAGVMAFRGSVAPLLDAIGNLNVKGEYYLTDLVELSNGKGLTVVALEGSEAEFLGVNTRIELAAAEAVFQENARKSAMAAGVTLIAPQTVWFSHDTVLARDVTVEPNVFFGPGVTVAEDVLIRANSHLEDTRIASGAIIGPFARLRPGTEIRANARIGNFVEIKNTVIGENAKVNHLTYIGDATLGDTVNVGAGTITCNYDGFDKHETKIGAGAFIGSNSALVAPVTIGAGAYIASGSVVTMDVPDDALAVGRGRQMNKEGWARDFRDLKRDRPEPD